MKAKPPVTRFRSGRISIDLLSVARAVKQGTLKPEDRATIDTMLPNVINRMEAGAAEDWIACLESEQGRREGQE